MEERKSLGAKGCYDQVQNAKWEIPDFFFSHWGQQHKGWLFPEPV